MARESLASAKTAVNSRTYSEMMRLTLSMRRLGAKNKLELIGHIETAIIQVDDIEIHSPP